MGKFYRSFQTCSTYGRGWFSSYSGNDTSFHKLKPSLALSSKWNMPGIQENWVEAEILCCRRPGKRNGTGDVKVLLLPHLWDQCRLCCLAYLLPSHSDAASKSPKAQRTTSCRHQQHLRPGIPHGLKELKKLEEKKKWLPEVWGQKRS